MSFVETFKKFPFGLQVAFALFILFLVGEIGYLYVFATTPSSILETLKTSLSLSVFYSSVESIVYIIVFAAIIVGIYKRNFALWILALIYLGLAVINNIYSVTLGSLWRIIPTIAYASFFYYFYWIRSFFRGKDNFDKKRDKLLTYVYLVLVAVSFALPYLIYLKI